MRGRILSFVLWAIIGAGYLGWVHPVRAADNPQHTLKDLSFLSGTWVGDGKDGTYIEEHWSQPVGDSMVGYCRFLKNGHATFYETLVINIDPDGIVLRMRHFNETLMPWSEKNESGDCRMVSCNKIEVVFDNNNKDHDVKVTYLRNNPNSMTATIEVTRDGKSEQHSFQYRLD